MNLSALDPVQLIQARKHLGVPFSRLLERRVVRIPVDRIAHQPAVTYDNRSHWLNSRPGEEIRASPPEDEFTPFDADAYEELHEPPHLHLEYLAEQLAAGQPALRLCLRPPHPRCRPRRHQRTPAARPRTWRRNSRAELTDVPFTR